ncbi:NADH-quinone oxidoreductase subunit L [Nitrospina gracilis]|uniref:NADH-quinone oxidoreductase subunit L n=1 Tax=Nitrospina gracilis TaxID=35801 RepID=UPI001F027D82|nr:NADH-quinone oxidoreductase subunit L [Nitrospina gracilis]MCF8719424.1 NADH-quinone oxidoreductase subunit L [Nitrospina gracilis Nb-211]
MTLFVLIPLLPLLASLILLLGGRRWGESGHRIGIPAIGLSFGLSVAAFIDVLRNGPFTISLYRLFQSGSLTIDLTLFVDQLTVLLLLLVTGVSAIVHVYSSRYMIGEPRYNRFFAIIALFTSTMILLVMSGNLLMSLVSWEVMGICSYLLISHAAERPSACRAATKAFLVNAVADVGFSFGIILTFFTFGTLDIQTILAQAEGMQDHTVNILAWMGLDLHIHPVTLIPFFLFMGAMGKSAQMPFHVWLPFAMEAPTPVSALIHAATMVNAGPFLLVRLSPLIALSPSAMAFIAIIGATTAVFAGIVSLTQSDIKKILAYSTISQIGFMVMACGLGAFAVAIFHLLAHGCYKAYFFLSTGNALRSVERHLEHGGHKHPAPERMGSLHGGALLLALIPPFVLFSGSYENLWGVTGFASATIGFKVIGLVTVFVASQYIFKGVASLFAHGPKTYWPASGQQGLRTQSVQPRFLNVPLLAGLFLATVFAGGLLTLTWEWFANFLAPALGLPGITADQGAAQPGFPVWLAVSLGVAVAGWAYAYSTQIRPRHQASRANATVHRLYVLFWNKGYFDEIYDAYLVTPTVRLAHWLWRIVDLRLIDRFIHSIATYSVSFARLLWRIVDMRVIDQFIHSVATYSVSFARLLWQIVDMRVIDRFIHFIANYSVVFARLLWRIVDIRMLDQKVERVAGQVNTAGQLLQEMESRTIERQLLVMIFWLGAMTALLYFLV